VAYPYEPTGFVFASNGNGFRGRVLSHSAVWRSFQDAQVLAGIVDEEGRGKYRFHALRHFFASAGIAAGFQPKRLQALLGHSSIQMTFDVYGHLLPDPEDDRTRMAAIERLVTEAGTARR
jgi:integrase